MRLAVARLWAGTTAAFVVLAALLFPSFSAVPAQALHNPHEIGTLTPGDDFADNSALSAETTVRFATFDAGLSRPSAGDLVEDLATRDDPQARAVAEIIQLNAPDVLVLNDIDYDSAGAAVALFKTNYLEVAENGADEARYPYTYVAAVNTGVPSGLDLNNDGRTGGRGDAFGPGAFEGQHGMAVLSKYPIETDKIRSFQNFLWKDMPNAQLPDDPASGRASGWYSWMELQKVRLSSVSHWDVPISVGESTIHALVSNPSPPPRNGLPGRYGGRNSDEIRLWSDYVSGGAKAAYLYDDDGGTGGLPRGARFVVLGDQNSDPEDGGASAGAVNQLLEHPLITDPEPISDGAKEAAALQGGVNDFHRGDAQFDTVDREDKAAGNTRSDYVLPARSLGVSGKGVFWPRVSTPGAELTGIFPFPGSAHRLVYVDVIRP